MQPSPSNREAAIVRGRALLDAAPTSSIAFVVPPVRAPYGVAAACFPSFIAHGLFFTGGGGGRGLSILDVEHSVCSYSLQKSPHELYFLSWPFDTLNFSCTLRPVFCSYCFNPCLAFFFLNSSYSPLALDSDQQKKFNSDHEKKNIISRRHLPFTRHFVFCHELVVG